MPLVVGAIVSAGLGTGSGLLSAFTNKKPKQPNLVKQGGKLAALEAELLPYLLREQAGMQTGSGGGMLPGYGEATFTAKQAQDWNKRLSNQLAQAEKEPDQLKGKNGVMTPNTKKQNKIAGLQAQLKAIPSGGGKVFVNKQGQPVPQNVAMPSMAGTSTADIQGTLMRQMNEGKLADAAQFDPQFIQSALDQLQQVNPLGTAARQEQAALIEKNMANAPKSPVADEMLRQAQEKLTAGSGLTPEEEKLLATAVQQSQGAKGASGATGPDFSRDLTTGWAGEQRNLANTGMGLAELTSGETPQDILNRWQQQNIGNLQRFTNQPTPESQFGYLSGAGNLATPYGPGGSLSPSNTNAGQQGATAAANQYSAQVGQALSTPNPWISGLSSLITGAGSMGMSL